MAIGRILIEHQLPGTDVRVVLVHHIGIVDDTHHAVTIGHAVPVFRIVFGILEFVKNIFLEVGDVVEIQRMQQPLFRHALDHVVGRNNHIVGHRSAGNLGIHILVGRIGGIIHLHLISELLCQILVEVVFKLGVHIHAAFTAVGNIFAPVVYIQRDRFPDFLRIGAHSRHRDPHTGQERHQCGKCNNSSHFTAPAFFFLFFFPSGFMKLITRRRARITTIIRVQRAYILNFTSCTV